MFKRILGISIGLCLISSASQAAPKSSCKKANYNDQAAMDLNAAATDDALMRIDGGIVDWNNVSLLKFATLMSGEYECDWTSERDLSGEVGAQYGAEKIYFYIKVKDNAVVSKKGPWKSDRVELWLAPEDANGKALGKPRGLLLDVGPQAAGGTAEAKWMSGKNTGANAAAFISPDGYDWEVSVDYSALSSKPFAMNGTMRFCVLVRDWDQDDKYEDEAAVGTCPINPKKSSSIVPSKMGKISLNLAESIWQRAAEQGIIADSPSWKKTIEDIGGTPVPEIIAVNNNTIAAVGYGSDNTLSVYTIELASSGNAQSSPQIAIKDINNDKKKEIIISREEPCIDGTMTASRDYIFVLDGGLQLKTTYIKEYHRNDGTGSVRNNYKFGKSEIVQTLGKSDKDMGHCELNGDANMIPVLVPSDDIKTRKSAYLYE